MDVRYILRNAYDGNFERAIQQLVEIAEQQQKEIESLKKDIKIIKGDSNE